ncbi:SWEET7B [Symbiodinium pilosum]|uniref:Sugar transporter SWEET1 n=1 Tax=Symbiodinium pilosum TaxID=2952 RepID=A0A812IZ27_SYMPI|nr:SWEET7B [Symbiodinium pilosum]
MTAPLTQTIDVIATPAKVQNVNPVNLLCFFLNCATQLGYGLFMPVAQVIPCNAYGVAVGFFSIITCWCLARRDEKADRWNCQACASTIFILGLSVLIIVYAGVGGERAPGRVGSLGMLVGIIMYAAPLSVLQEVIRTKSSAPLPVMQIFLGFLNSLCWLAVGLRNQKLPVWAPNVFGMLLSLIQLVLILKYPAKQESDVEAAEENPAPPLKEHVAADFVRSRTGELAETVAEISVLVKSVSGIFENNPNMCMEHNTNESTDSQEKETVAGEATNSPADAPVLLGRFGRGHKDRADAVKKAVEEDGAAASQERRSVQL